MVKMTLRRAVEYTVAVVRWLPFSLLTGLVCGAVGVAFHFGIQYGSAYRMAHPWVLYLLPVGGLLILLLYRLFRIPEGTGTNQVIEAARTGRRIPVLLAPAMLLSTVLTHFLGGSAGREGAALQIGGSLAGGLSNALRVPESERPTLTLCGMSAVFSALFGTPVTAALFVLEVEDVGHFRYAALPHCLASALVAYLLNKLAGAERVRLTLPFPESNVTLVLQTAALAILCGLLSIAFCVTVHRCENYTGRLIKNRFLRAAVLGALLLAMTLLSGGQTYNGAGMETVERAVSGGAVNWYDFLLKLAFTAVTLAAGYKGGEIVPTFFVGAAFGAIVGPLLGLDAGLAAAIGMVAVFCGAVNSPIAAIFLSIEVFGGGGLTLFAVACVLSYTFSGYFGLYSSQHILDSKTGPEENIDIHTLE